MKTPRRYIEKADLQPNQGWLSLHESGSYGYNLANDSRLSEVQGHLNDVEDRVRAIVNIPFHILRLTTQQIQELVLAHVPFALRRQVLAALRGELGNRVALKKTTRQDSKKTIGKLSGKLARH